MITQRINPDGSITVGIIDDDDTYSIPKEEPKEEKPKAEKPKTAPKKSAKKSK